MLPSLVVPPSLVAPSLSHRNVPLSPSLSHSCIAPRLSLNKDTDNDDTEGDTNNDTNNNTNDNGVLIFLSS